MIAATHTIQAGDTYSSIAAQYGVSVSSLEAGSGYAPDALPIGQSISVGSSGTSFTVHSGLQSYGHSYSQSEPSSSSSSSESPVSAPSSSTPSSSGTEGCIVNAESTGNPDASNGDHYGLYQMTPDLWKQGGGSGSSAEGASSSEQHQVYENIVNNDINGGLSNWTQYDGC